jgi:hypothetical protein
MDKGKVHSFGPKEEVLKKVLRSAPPMPLRPVVVGQGAGS